MLPPRQGSPDSASDCPISVGNIGHAGPSKQLGQEVEIWFSEPHNYLINKIVGKPTAANRTETEVVKFTELAPGIFFPELTEVRRFTTTGSALEQTASFSEIRLDRDHRQGVFDFKFPKRAKLVNVTMNQVYETDELGNPLGNVTRAADVPSGRPAPTQALSPPPSSLTETKEEPKTVTRYILPSSVGLLTAAAGWWYIRRARRQ